LAPVFGFVLRFDGFQQRYGQEALQHFELQRSRIDDAELQMLNDPVERRLGHGASSAVTAVNSKLRSRADREQLIALAERMLEGELRYPAESGD
jgi:hypothetical protein